jgi:hypothetical protein
VANLPFTFTTTGTFDITATYSPGSNFIASGPASLTQIVRNSSTVKANAIAGAAFGATLSYAVSVTSPSGTPSGTISVYINGSPTAYGTYTLASNGTVTIPISGLPAAPTTAPNSIVFSYSGDTVGTGHEPSSATVSQAVGSAATTTTITAWPGSPATTASVVYGNTVSFAATVVATGNGVPNPTTGTVTFLDSSTNTQLGSPVTLVGSNVATLPATAQTLAAAAAHSIVAVYNDTTNSNYTKSTSVGKALTVSAAGTSLTFTAPTAPASSYAGSAVTFNVQVAATNSPSNPTTGSVTFRNGATVLGTANINASGVATLTVAMATTGAETITATYNGSAPNFAASTAATLPGGLLVQKATTQVTLSGPTSASYYGQAATFTATVSATNGSPGALTGTVVFWQGATSTGAGGIDLGSAMVTSGKAVLTTTPTGLAATTTAGLPIFAVYTSTNANATGNTSAPLPYIVNQAVTTATLTSSIATWVLNTPITFTATVVAATGGYPVGQVALVITGPGGVSVATLAAVTLVNGTAKFAPVTLPNLVGSYTATLNFTAGASPAPTNTINFTNATTSQTQSDVRNSGAASVAASVNGVAVKSVIVNSPFTLTAVLTGVGIQSTIANGGTVQFFDGTKSLGYGTVVTSTSGSVTFSLANVVLSTPGTHNITVQYSGDQNFDPFASVVLSLTAQLRLF